MSFLFWIILGGIWIFYNCFKERKTDKTSSEVVIYTLAAVVAMAIVAPLLYGINSIVSMIISDEYDDIREFVYCILSIISLLLIMKLIRNHEKKETARYEESKRLEDDAALKSEDNK